MEADMMELLHTGSDDQSLKGNSSCELLNITNAAVEALDKPEASPKKPEGRIIYADPKKVVPEASDILDIHNISQTSLSSRATDASDVLIRSTNEDLHNTSHTSKASSQASSFLTGAAKPVRISVKMLKEIKSPFDAEEISTVSRSSSRGSDMAPEAILPKTSSKNNSKDSSVNNSVDSLKGKKAETSPRTVVTVADSGYTTHKGTSEQEERSIKGINDGTLEGIGTLQEDSIIDVVAKSRERSPSTASNGIFMMLHKIANVSTLFFYQLLVILSQR
jgi:hypothetical protein